WHRSWLRRCRMLPLRIELQGFLSYREKTVLDFRDDWLWAITGKNGAGKSAIFDGMTFALYGEHRGGGQHEDLLMHKGCDYTRVAFDFAVGRDAYRVERTIERRGRRRSAATFGKTYSAYCIDPLEISPTRAQSIPNTDKVTSLEDWVRRIVGL